MLTPEAISQILSEYQDELADREPTEMLTPEAFQAELARFVEERLPE